MRRFQFLIYLILCILFCNVSWAVEDYESTGLKSLRLEIAGIEPKFNADINEYYLVVDGGVNSIGVNAVPKSDSAVVEVTGNIGLKYGMNVISVAVNDANRGEKKEYFIYVTKTDYFDNSNARLLNLAVKQGKLEPEFSPEVTRYRLEVANDVYRLDVLGVAERINAIVELSGNENLDIGDNFVWVKVVAEDGLTFRNYLIIVHRRSAEEESSYIEDRKAQTERLHAILNDESANNGRVNIGNNGDVNNVYIGLLIIVSGLIIGAGLYFIKRKIG